MRLDTVRHWIGERVDDAQGAKVGIVRGLYLDNESRTPLWLIVRLGRTEQYSAIPLDRAMSGSGRVSVPHGRETIRTSPPLVISRPLSPKHELELCRHYGVDPTRGAMASSWERRTCAFAVGDVDDAGILQAVQATQLRGPERRRGLVGDVAGATAAA